MDDTSTDCWEEATHTRKSAEFQDSFVKLDESKQKTELLHVNIGSMGNEDGL